MSYEIIQGQTTCDRTLKIGVVTSRFNLEVTEKLESGALEQLVACGLRPEQVLRVRVPGAVEIPLAAKWLLERGCDGVIALGAVIKGDTAHFESVCRAVDHGLMELQLSTGRPIAFGVLTTYDEQQAMDRAGGSLGNKGQEAAQVLIEMINLEMRFNKLPPTKGEPYDQPSRNSSARLL